MSHAGEPYPVATGSTRTYLVLAPSSGFGGGIERVAESLCESLPGDVVRVDLFRSQRTAQPQGGLLAKMRFTCDAILQCVRHRPDEIVCMLAGLLPIAVVLGTAGRRPVTLVAYGIEVWAPMTNVERFLVRRCSRLLAISSFTADLLARRARVDRSLVVVLPLAIPDSLARAAIFRDVPAEPVPSNVVLTVGRMDRDHRYKGHLWVAEAWPLVIAARPDARWLVIGDGNDVGALEARCVELGIQETVIVRRSVDDGELADAYAHAAVMVLPSIADVDATPPTGEGFGLVYAEAGAFGVPSIAAVSGGGSSDIVEDGISGLTVQPGDSGALALAILALLDDAELRRRLGTAARDRVRERHLPDGFAARVRASFSGLPRTE